MENLKIWIIESAHISPNDYYVELDGSPNYKAYWAAQTYSAQLVGWGKLAHPNISKLLTL